MAPNLNRFQVPTWQLGWSQSSCLTFSVEQMCEMRNDPGIDVGNTRRLTMRVSHSDPLLSTV